MREARLDDWAQGRSGKQKSRHRSSSRKLGELRFNDALLLVSQRLRMPLTELMHEWDLEVDWPREWGDRKDGLRGPPASSSSSRPNAPN